MIRLIERLLTCEPSIIRVLLQQHQAPPPKAHFCHVFLEHHGLDLLLGFGCEWALVGVQEQLSPGVNCKIESDRAVSTLQRGQVSQLVSS